ncbi:MAG: response regulator [Bacilli bacterium]|nr:response regulator [Bacilli bacterium]
MISSFYIQITSLTFMILLAIIFFTKSRIKSTEIAYFKYLLLTVIGELILELLLDLTIPMNNSILSDYVFKIYSASLLVFDSLFTSYIFSLKPDRKNKKRESLILKIVLLVTIFVTIILPVDLINNGKVAYASGPAVSFLTAVVTPIYYLIWLIFIIKNKKKIRFVKITPVILSLLGSLVVFIIQSIWPGLIITLTVESLTIFLLYFTIENPDLKLIEQLNLAKEQADKANRAKTEFLSSMSHEIRTPLNAIVGFSNSLNENPNLPEEVKNDVKDILTASDNLLEIVNGVLDISKIEANKIEIIKKEYDTKKVFDELIKLTKVRIGEKPIEFESKIDESIPRVLYGDNVRVKQVILNLLTNAAKYTDQGKITFKVNSVIKDDVIRLIISVEDTGKGIKPEDINKLFTKFERLDEERNTTIEGTGLGLAITKRLLELMGGRIVVQSVYGKGSKFTATIDQKIVKNPTINLEETTTLEEQIDLTGQKVLVVDDNKLNIKVATRLLEAYKLDITSVLSGEETLELLKKDNSFDIILLDDMMPKMSGTETLNHIKTDNLYTGPIVALTANALTGMKEKYIEAGFDDYLAKPIEKAELDRVLKRYLKK